MLFIISILLGEEEANIIRLSISDPFQNSMPYVILSFWITMHKREKAI